MQKSVEKLTLLKQQLTQVTKDVEAGKLAAGEAAEKIIQLREEMDKIVERLRDIAKK